MSTKKMKKSFFILSLLLVQSVWLFSQTNIEEKEKASIAKNKIKIQSQWSYDYENGKPSSKGFVSMQTTYDPAGNVLQIVNFRSSGQITSVTVYTYNKNGDKTSWTRYKGNKEELVYNQKIIYDDKNRKIGETGFDGMSNFMNTFTYDASGKLTEIKYTTDRVLSEKRIFTHSGNKTELNILNPASIILSKEITTYDGKGNIIEEVKYVQNNVAQKYNYQYTTTGKKIEETKINFGTLSYRKKYIYDKQENLLKIMEETPEGKPFISYIYQFDNNGNVIEEKWAKDATSEYSNKKHRYNATGLIQETDSYSASYKFSVLYKYTYQAY